MPERRLANSSAFLKPAGRLVLIDINYPADENRLGTPDCGNTRAI